jgi:hypothetical protein
MGESYQHQPLHQTTSIFLNTDITQAHANASTFHGDPNRMYTAGGSAGGALALQIANKIVKDPELKSSLKGVAALVPCTAHWDSIPDKYKSKYTAYEDNKKGTPIIDKGSMEIFYEYVHPPLPPFSRSMLLLNQLCQTRQMRPPRPGSLHPPRDGQPQELPSGLLRVLRIRPAAG